MANQYGIKNKYVPTSLAPKAYGWRRRGYVDADVPTSLAQRPTNLTAEQFRQQFAYEWLNSGEIQGAGYSNPPFVSGAAGRLLPSLHQTNYRTGDGGETNNLRPTTPQRITRGFIRRAETEASDEKSKARLNFMYNPEVITREYVSYLDQTALDPFNTVYQSGNLVAPPSILDFSFSLFFDRQEEATNAEHPGVFVDYQFFDLVVRNVVPTSYSSTSNTLPDSGVMMVNPREITVVFSPQLTVQGRPLNARVSFLKFTHKMVPTRMQIDLTMRATYFGPLKPQSEYVREQFAAQDTIPYRLEDGFNDVGITFEETVIDFDGSSDNSDEFNTSGSANPDFSDSEDHFSADHNVKALAWIKDHVKQGTTKYKQGTAANSSLTNAGSPGYPDGYYPSLDCSSLVCRAYQGIGLGQVVGAPRQGITQATKGMMQQWVWNKTLPAIVHTRSEVTTNPSLVKKGALLLENGHVGFFNGWDGAPGGSWSGFQAQGSTPGDGIQVGVTPRGSWPSGSWDHVVYPLMI